MSWEGGLHLLWKSWSRFLWDARSLSKMDQSPVNLSCGRIPPPLDVSFMRFWEHSRSSELMGSGGTKGGMVGSELKSWGRWKERLNDRSHGFWKCSFWSTGTDLRAFNELNWSSSRIASGGSPLWWFFFLNTLQTTHPSSYITKRRFLLEWLKMSIVAYFCQTA